MINIMLVAGKSTDNLKKYFNQRGTLEVTHSYPSLAMYRDEIERNYIKVDKLVYVYQDSGMNIVKDMSFLKRLLTLYMNDEGLLNIGEIEFFYINSDETAEGVKLFKAITKETKFTNYKIYASKEALSFEGIYNHLFGLTKASAVKTQRKKVYRRTKDSPIKNIYEQEDYDEDEVLEPWDYKSLEDYEKSKEFAKQSDTGKYYVDNRSTSEIEGTFTDPVLHGYNINSVVHNKNIYFYSGEIKSGVSVNTAMGIASALKEGKRITYVNLTGNNDSRSYLKYLDIGHVSMNLKTFMSKTDLKDIKSQLQIINVNYTLTDIRVEGLRYIIENQNKLTHDILVIECPKDILNDSLECIGLGINRVFYSVETLENEINKTFNFVNNIAQKLKVVVMLANNLKEFKLHSKPKLKIARRMTTDDIKRVFTKDITIIAPIEYDGVDDELFRTLTEV